MRVGNGGFSLRSRKLLAALAGSADHARRRRGHDDRAHVPAAARARARHPLRRRGAGRPLLVRGRVPDRHAVRLPRPVQFLPDGSAGGDRSAGAGVLRRDRALAAAPLAPAQLRRARPMGCGARDRHADPRRAPRPRRSAGAARQGGARGGAGAAVGPQRSLPLRQRQKLQALPRRASGGRLRLRARGRRLDRRCRRARARRDDGAPAGDLDAAERGYRAALARAPASDGDAYPRRRRCTSAGASPRRCRCSRPPRRPCRTRPSSTTIWASRSRRRTGSKRRSPRTGGRSRCGPSMRPHGAISGSRCRRKIVCPTRLTPTAGDRARARLRAGALEPRARAARAPGFRGGLARIRVAPPGAGVRAPRAPLAADRAGTARRRRAHAAGDHRARPGRHAAIHPSCAAARGARRARDGQRAGAARPAARERAGRRRRVRSGRRATRVRCAGSAARPRRHARLTADVDSRDRALPCRRRRAPRGDRRGMLAAMPAYARSASPGRAAAATRSNVAARSIPSPCWRRCSRCRTSRGSRCKRSSRRRGDRRTLPERRVVASLASARRFRRHGGAGRGTRSRRQRRHQHRASWRRARAARRG